MYSRPNTPKAFKDMCTTMDLDPEEDPFSIRQLIVDASRVVPKTDMMSVRDFIAGLLDDGWSDADFEKLWNSTSPRILLVERNYRSFMSLMKSVLDERIAQAGLSNRASGGA